jgi:hypothetical protein
MNGQRRAGIKRTSGIKRTPFARKPPAAEPRHAVPGRGLARRTRLKARSAKTAKIYRDKRVPLVQDILAVRRLCEIRWDENCGVRSEGLHEILSRGRGGSITDEPNVLAACHYCNGAVSDNPAEAEARGFLLPSGRPRKAVPRHAAATP